MTMANQVVQDPIDLRLQAHGYDRFRLMTPSPHFRLLAALQLAAGLVTLSFALLQLDTDSRHGAEAALSAGWLLMALFSAIVGPRKGRAAQSFSLSMSSALLAAGSAIAVHPSVQILNGIGIMLVGVFAAYTLSLRRLMAFLVFSVAIYLASIRSTSLFSDMWVPLTVVAMLVFNTAHVWTLVNRLRETTLTDPLTGALNRNGLAAKAADVRAVADRAGNPTTVTVIDLDKFKQTNDMYGHAAGDRVLIDTVSAWCVTLRNGDQLARVGGDEFVLLTPNCDPQQAEAVLERLRAVSPCTWTSGSVLWERDEEDVFSAIRRADDRMYAAKRSCYEPS